MLRPWHAQVAVAAAVVHTTQQFLTREPQQHTNPAYYARAFCDKHKRVTYGVKSIRARLTANSVTAAHCLPPATMSGSLSSAESKDSVTQGSMNKERFVFVVANRSVFCRDGCGSRDRCRRAVRVACSCQGVLDALTMCLCPVVQECSVFCVCMLCAGSYCRTPRCSSSLPKAT
jgi:hypothetical protein